MKTRGHRTLTGILSILLITVALSLGWLATTPQDEWPGWINGCRHSIMAALAKQCYVKLEPTDGLLWPNGAPDNNQLPAVSTIIGSQQHRGASVYTGPIQTRLDLRFPWAIIHQEDYQFCIDNPKRSLIINAQNRDAQWAIPCSNLPSNPNLSLAPSHSALYFYPISKPKSPSRFIYSFY